MSEDEKWFGVRCVYRHQDGPYEERITIWPARSFDAAIELAEREARGYAAILSCKYLGLAQAYGPLTDVKAGDAELVPESAGTEVFSLMRDGDLGPDEYIKRFFATGKERERDADASAGKRWNSSRAMATDSRRVALTVLLRQTPGLDGVQAPFGDRLRQVLQEIMKLLMRDCAIAS